MTWHDYLHHSIDILNILTPIVGPLRHQQERFYRRDSSSGITCTCDTRTPTHRVLCPEIEPPALQHILAYPRTLEAIASSTVKSSFQHPSASGSRAQSPQVGLLCFLLQPMPARNDCQLKRVDDLQVPVWLLPAWQTTTDKL